MANRTLIAASRLLYERLARPLIFQSTAQRGHERMLAALARMDNNPAALKLLSGLHSAVFEQQPVTAGGVALPQPLILAAGLVKGCGFADETIALAAVESGDNIMPGWHAVPRLVGAVEFGSFTRWPRPGNPGVVIWRDAATCSSQNRVGLKNPGARAAAAFLGRRTRHLPPVYGINIAASPGIDDPQQEQEEMLTAAGFFLEAGIRPSWLTINLSCPNTEDDPGAHQTETRARLLCRAAAATLPPDISLWVKLSPDLSDEQYRILMRVFADEGARAVIATNTLPQPAPDQPGLTAGVGGGRLHAAAVSAAAALLRTKAEQGYNVDIIGCGGVMDAITFRDFTQLGIQVVQYWTALIYRGPLAAALIMDEVKHA